MTDNLPAVRQSTEVATADTDSWITVMADVARLSAHIAETEFVPRNLRNKAPAVAAAILYGREVGLPPMTALTQTHVIEGRPSMSAEAMRALVVAAGHEFVTEETTGAVCRMRARRRGEETWTAIEWTIDMARAAGLSGKDNWKNYPRQMLQARCTAELIRLVFPDVIHGFRALEELDETGEADDNAASGFDQPAATVQRTTRKRTAKKSTTAALPPAPPAQRPVPQGPPLPGEEEPPQTAGEGTAQEQPAEPAADAPESGGEAAGEPSPAPDQAPEPEPEPEQQQPSAPPRAISRAQQRMLHSQFGGFDMGDDEHREARLLVTSKIVGRPVESTNDLTSEEASGVIDTLARCQTVADVHALVEAIDEAEG